jgi:hypothetical protein
MDKSKALETVQRYLKKIAGKYQIESAIIFSSYARVTGQYWDCGYVYMTVYPNPAGNDFVIDLDIEKAGIEEINRNLEFILTITDNMGAVKYNEKIVII